MSASTPPPSDVPSKIPQIKVRKSISDFLHHHHFTVTPTRFTSVPTLYKHWSHFENDALIVSNTTLRHFQTALGRVLRPKGVKGNWENVWKSKQWYNVSTEKSEIEWRDLKAHMRRERDFIGTKRRKVALEENEDVRRKKAERRRRAEESKINGNAAHGQNAYGVTAEKENATHLGHLDEFVKLKCGSDLLELKLYPNAKELTESMGAFAAAREFIMRKDSSGRFGTLDSKDEKVTVVVVGDGCTPRTAAMFAYRTSWRCVSIDPVLRCDKDKPYIAVQRLELKAAKVQDVKVPIQQGCSVIMVLWHTHVSLNDAVQCIEWAGNEDRHSMQIRQRMALIACPCCNWDEKQQAFVDGSSPDVEYMDNGVASGKRKVRVWRLLRSSSESNQ